MLEAEGLHLVNYGGTYNLFACLKKTSFISAAEVDERQKDEIDKGKSEVEFGHWK